MEAKLFRVNIAPFLSSVKTLRFSNPKGCLGYSGIVQVAVTARDLLMVAGCKVFSYLHQFFMSEILQHLMKLSVELPQVEPLHEFFQEPVRLGCAIRL